MDTARPLTILLVAADAADAGLIGNALTAAGPSRLTTVADGRHALALLRGDHRDDGTPHPDLVIVAHPTGAPLDGHDVVRLLKGDPLVRRLPVVLLAATAAEDDLAAAYASHVNAYLVQPRDPAALCALMEALTRFWGLAQRPTLPARR